MGNTIYTNNEYDHNWNINNYDHIGLLEDEMVLLKTNITPIIDDTNIISIDELETENDNIHIETTTYKIPQSSTNDKPKRKTYKCPHGKQTTYCVICGGNSYCKHKTQRSKCKKCKGGSVCIHNNIRSRCIDCNGGSYCRHRVIRSRCNICKGGSICEHNVQRYTCVKCPGKGICLKHRKQKSKCVLCKDAANKK